MSTEAMSTPVTRRSMARWVPLVVVVAVNTAVSLSSSVSKWWDVQSAPGTTSLPAVTDWVLRARANSSNADVHTVLWFLAAVALVWALRPVQWHRLMIASAALWAYTGLMEIGQHWVPTRTPQWIDLAGNGLGIAAGLAVGCGAMVVWRRFGRSGSPSAPRTYGIQDSARG